MDLLGGSLGDLGKLGIRKSDRQRRGPEKRTPRRSKSSDVMELFGASLGDLGKLGVSFDPSLTFGLGSTSDDKSPSRNRPLSRAKSMTMNQDPNHMRDLRNGLSRVDKNSGTLSSRRCDDYKSTGGASTGTNSTKRSSGSSRESLISDAEQAERILKEQAKLAREQRRAEEAKLKRLQEESRLLEEKTRSEAMRLKALKEEAKVLEAKRMEEEARVRVEAKMAQEQRKMESARQRQIEEERATEDTPQDQNMQGLKESSDNKEEMPGKEETMSLSAGWQDTNSQSVESQPQRRSSSSSLSQPENNKKKFGGSPESIQHLPPAFQVLYKQSKRADKM